MYIVPMPEFPERIQLPLTEEQLRRLKQRRKTDGVPVTVQIRRAIDHAVGLADADPD